MKTTTAHYNYFVKRCKHWVNFFGLKHFELNFRHVFDEFLATASIKVTGDTMVTFSLCKDWGQFPITYTELDKCAFHEVCHLLLSEMDHACRAYIADFRVDGMGHKVIRCLENTIWERLKDK